LRSDFEAAVPHGRTANGDPKRDRGAWHDVPGEAEAAWAGLVCGYECIVAQQPKLGRGPAREHLGTLGTGNHFVELCLDEQDRVWVMLHSGSRGVGNRIGSHYIALAKREMERWFIALPDQDLAYFAEGTPLFGEYVGAVGWAQRYAEANREVMMARLVEVLQRHFPDLESGEVAVNCHHNYVQREHHFGADVWVTRKGAVKADLGDLGIIPGSMGARSFIVRGKGNPDSFCSCSHGAGRAMSRNEARKRFTLADHAAATEGVECRKDAAVIDETPMAYKDIDAVMAAQSDLVEVVHTLKQVLCVKG
jgi:tRNA-splicing ligase RtcB